MTKEYRLDGCDGLVYYGNSDFLAQVADHIQRYPNSCLTKNIVGFYTSLYSEVFDPDTCDYQVEINEELCPELELGNEAEAIDLLLDFLEGQPRRVARRAINRIRRKGLREIVRNTAPTVEVLTRMAKYDTYVIVATIGDDKARAELRLSVLFEDGDDIDAVITSTRDRVKTEAEDMKRSDFLKNIKPLPKVCYISLRATQECDPSLDA